MIELAIFKAFREVPIEVLSFGFGVAELVLVRLLSTARRQVLPRSHRGLRRIQTNTQSRNRNTSFIVELDSETIET